MNVMVTAECWFPRKCYGDTTMEWARICHGGFVRGDRHSSMSRKCFGDVRILCLQKKMLLGQENATVAKFYCDLSFLFLLLFSARRIDSSVYL